MEFIIEERKKKVLYVTRQALEVSGSSYTAYRGFYFEEDKGQRVEGMDTGEGC
jgi:hypothetical protein